MDRKSIIEKVKDGLPIAFIASAVGAVGISSIIPILHGQSYADNPKAFLLLTLATGTAVLLAFSKALSAKIFDPTAGGKIEFNIEQANEHLNKIESLPEESFLSAYSRIATESRSVARTLFSRAGVYIIVGVMAALVGIALFEFMIRFDSLKDQAEGLPYFFRIAPNLSVLLLCELIAFFFLRQSRGLMDEFRYFDGIARHREEVLVLLRLNKEADKPLAVGDILTATTFFSKGASLAPGETTEIVETRKLEKTELEILAAAVEAISRSKDKA